MGSLGVGNGSVGNGRTNCQVAGATARDPRLSSVGGGFVLFLMCVSPLPAIHFRCEYNYFRSRNVVANAIRPILDQ